MRVLAASLMIGPMKPPLPWTMTQHPAGSPRGFAHCVQQARLKRRGYLDFAASGRAEPGDDDLIAEQVADAIDLASRFALAAREAGIITEMDATRLVGPDDAEADVVIGALRAMGCACDFCVRRGIAGP